MNYDIWIHTPLYHPKRFYKWVYDEMGIGIAFKHIKTANPYLIVKVGKDDKNLYKIDKKAVVEFSSKYNNSWDECKGTRLVVIPLGKWGKRLGIYKKIKVQGSLL